MDPWWIRAKLRLGAALTFNYLPLTILAALSVISLLSRVILLLR